MIDETGGVPEEGVLPNTDVQPGGRGSGAGQTDEKIEVLSPVVVNKSVAVSRKEEGKLALSSLRSQKEESLPGTATSEERNREHRAKWVTVTPKIKRATFGLKKRKAGSSNKPRSGWTSRETPEVRRALYKNVERFRRKRFEKA